MKPARGEGERQRDEKFLQDFKDHYNYKKWWETMKAWIEDIIHDDGVNARAYLEPDEVLERMKEIEKAK